MCRCLLCYGDSNTYGYDPRSYLGGRYLESVRWTALLRRYGWQVCNRGENGRSIPSSDREISMTVQSLCRMDADVLTVMLGSNDLLQASVPSAQECSKRMERFLTTLLHADEWEKSRKILLVAPPPMTMGDWVHDGEIIAAVKAELTANPIQGLGIGHIVGAAGDALGQAGVLLLGDVVGRLINDCRCLLLFSFVPS